MANVSTEAAARLAAYWIQSIAYHYLMLYVLQKEISKVLVVAELPVLPPVITTYP